MTAGVLAAVLVGALSFGALVPFVADLLLRRSYRRSCTWWWDSYGRFRMLGRDGPETGPRVSAFGEEGAVALWLEDALAAARSGVLPRERARALAEAGCDVSPEIAVRCEAEQEERCTFKAGKPARVACAAAGAAGAALLSLAAVPPIDFALLALCWLALAAGAVCDAKARILPLEACGAIAAAGALFQLRATGSVGIVWGLGAAVVLWSVCLAVNRLCRRTGRIAVGRGDMRCMAALSVASGPAAPIGFAACYAAAGAFALGGVAAGKLRLGDGIPMAPFLALWFACAAGATIAC